MCTTENPKWQRKEGGKGVCTTENAKSKQEKGSNGAGIIVSVVRRMERKGHLGPGFAERTERQMWSMKREPADFSQTVTEILESSNHDQKL
jgi:hypothetical protein